MEIAMVQPRIWVPATAGKRREGEGRQEEGRGLKGKKEKGKWEGRWEGGERIKKRRKGGREERKRERRGGDRREAEREIRGMFVTSHNLTRYSVEKGVLVRCLGR